MSYFSVLGLSTNRAYDEAHTFPMLTRSITLPFLSERASIRLDGHVHPDFVSVADALRRQLERSR